MVSPIAWWPLEGKLAVSGATLVLLVTYLRGGRTPRAPREENEEPVVAHTAGSPLALAPVTARRAP